MFSPCPNIGLLAGPYAAWPGDPPGSAMFAPGFALAARPGNGLLEGVPAPSPAAPAAASSGGGLSVGAIVGIAAGALACAGVWPCGGSFPAGRVARPLGAELKARACSAATTLCAACPPSAPAPALPTRRILRLAAVAASLAACVLKRRRWGVCTDAPSPWKGPASEDGWGGKDLEAGGSAGKAGLHSAGSSARSSLGAASPPPAAVGNLTSAMGGSAACGVAPPGAHSLVRADSRVSDGDGLPQALPDTDVTALPCGDSRWSSVRFDDLTLSRVLGRGSFGAVYLAQYCQTTGKQGACVCVCVFACASVVSGGAG